LSEAILRRYRTPVDQWNLYEFPRSRGGHRPAFDDRSGSSVAVGGRLHHGWRLLGRAGARPASWRQTASV